MFISASRRTDIPTYYSEWFFNRLKAGFALVRNPMNAKQISEISLTPDVVDGFVFWTKNPAPMLDKLKLLGNYGYQDSYYFQFTVNSYGKEIERGVPSKKNRVIPAFEALSDMIGPERVVWRYDPIFINKTYNVEYHVKYFEELAKRLSKYTKKCTFSFLDFYRNTERNISGLDIEPFTPEIQENIAARLAEIARRYNLAIDACAEAVDLEKYGIQRARCIDDRLFGKLLNRRLNVKKDENRRAYCGCAESVDIGAYNGCKNGCLYCYANFSSKSAAKNFCRHDPTSPLLFGELGEGEMPKKRKMEKHSAGQTTIF